MTETPEIRRVALVTGLAGAGRASILRSLEDVGYEAVDNPPLDLIDGLVASITQGRTPLTAIGLDARGLGDCRHASTSSADLPTTSR